jgi:Tol biopolymer transport system component
MKLGYGTKQIGLIISGVIILGIVIFTLFSIFYIPDIKNFKQSDEYPQIFPDYSNLVLPPNIAPLNFEIKESGSRYLVKVYSKNKSKITLYQKDPIIKISLKSWKHLLVNNINDSIKIEIYVKQKKSWLRYKAISNFISKDKIDPFIYYRDIPPTNSFWNEMAMHQRDLESFDEYEIFNNSRTDNNCMNCHTFNHNNPDQMLFHIRGKHSGTVFYNDGKLKKINLKTPQTISPGAYCNWHPSGKLVAFATNKIFQNYYLSGYGGKIKEVYDVASDIVLYNLATNTLFSFPQISSKRRENLPCWSPDGKYLYFTSAKEYVKDMPNEESIYSLMRVKYDAETNSMGEPEVLISAEEIGKSIAFPTISPNGRYMLFCMVDFGYFPVNNKSADLWIMDLQTLKYEKPDVNSSESESYFSWSNNNRWFVFSSRRLDGICSKPFISHIDSLGHISKPFVLPQEDPEFYAVNHRNFARPELISRKANLNYGKLKDVIYSEPIQAKYDSTNHFGKVTSKFEKR